MSKQTSFFRNKIKNYISLRLPSCVNARPSVKSSESILKTVLSKKKTVDCCTVFAAVHEMATKMVPNHFYRTQVQFKCILTFLSYYFLEKIVYERMQVESCTTS